MRADAYRPWCLYRIVRRPSRLLLRVLPLEEHGILWEIESARQFPCRLPRVVGCHLYRHHESFGATQRLLGRRRNPGRCNDGSGQGSTEHLAHDGIDRIRNGQPLQGLRHGMHQTDCRFIYRCRWTSRWIHFPAHVLRFRLRAVALLRPAGRGSPSGCRFVHGRRDERCHHPNIAGHDSHPVIPARRTHGHSTDPDVLDLFVVCDIVHAIHQESNHEK
mmetsp:Transcript_23165/g.49329  ORF Transcript_23165/g.49329 Transcript_23165/m.49329 type:complete len:218 (+) Transcript_23165:396-1049(+)